MTSTPTSEHGGPVEASVASLIGGRYEVVSVLGQGGFGTTHAAIDRRTGERVAVKVLDLRRIDDWKAVELFEREARVLQSLRHPGIPAYVEFRPLEADREAYLVQGLAAGESLAALLGRRRFTEAELVDLARRVLEILQYLGSLHPVVVHRDIKPANIVLDDDGTVSLVDFGAVRDIAAPGGGSTVAGTFGYMAPEQLQGEASPRSDLYGLGMTLVHLMTGIEPSELPQKRLKPDFRPHAQLSEALEAFVDRLIEPVPDDRFGSASEALAALESLRGSDPASSEAIARLREEAERAAAERATARRESAERVVERAPRAEGHRVEVVEDAEGLTAMIRPAPYWRGREAHFGVLVVLGPILAVAVGGPIADGAGITVGLVATVAIAVALWLTAPTWHLRVTKRGDFVLYRSRPDDPKWIGPLASLRLRSSPTQNAGPIAYLEHLEGEESRTMTIFPLSHADVGRLRRVVRGP